MQLRVTAVERARNFSFVQVFLVLKIITDTAF